MNLQAEKIELIKLLLNTDNPKIIQSIKDVFKRTKPTDFWNKLSFEQQEEIKQGSKEILEGKTTDYETFIEKHR